MHFLVLFFLAADERATVQQIHDRIVAKSKEEFRQYKETIPSANVSFEMIPIKAGDFLMGTPDLKDESPQHPVHISAVWFGQHEVTWDEYRAYAFSRDEG